MVQYIADPSQRHVVTASSSFVLGALKGFWKGYSDDRVHEKISNLRRDGDPHNEEVEDILSAAEYEDLLRSSEAVLIPAAAGTIIAIKNNLISEGNLASEVMTELYLGFMGFCGGIITGNSIYGFVSRINSLRKS